MVFLSAIGLLLLAGEAARDAAAAQPSTVSIADFRFSPADVQATMVPGEPGFPQPHAHVGFVNSGAVPHTVTFDDGRVPSSPTLEPNQFFDAVITSTGTFSYRCSIHPQMEGRITVAPLPTTTTTTTTAPPTTASPATEPPPAAVTTAAPAVTSIGPRAAVAAATTTAPSAVTTPTSAPTTTTFAPTSAPVETPKVSTNEPPSTTTAAELEGRVSTAARKPASESPRWSVVIVLLVLLGGTGVFLGSRIWRRPRNPISDD